MQQGSEYLHASFQALVKPINAIFYQNPGTRSWEHKMKNIYLYYTYLKEKKKTTKWILHRDWERDYTLVIFIHKHTGNLLPDQWMFMPPTLNYDYWIYNYLFFHFGSDTVQEVMRKSKNTQQLMQEVEQ